MCSGMKVAYRAGDVVVAGGGVSSIIAAIASARNGADTILIERYGYLGGMFTCGNMAVLNAPRKSVLPKQAWASQCLHISLRSPKLFIAKWGTFHSERTGRKQND